MAYIPPISTFAINAMIARIAHREAFLERYVIACRAAGDNRTTEILVSEGVNAFDDIKKAIKDREHIS